mmetsp:Transcript_52772/g.112954  ORF Transcript_52772/g.112954 Transcript_52772/m.112954 type:complete len:185 (-) Transcript_52772:81-635(-)
MISAMAQAIVVAAALLVLNEAAVASSASTGEPECRGLVAEAAWLVPEGSSEATSLVQMASRRIDRAMPPAPTGTPAGQAKVAAAGPKVGARPQVMAARNSSLEAGASMWLQLQSSLRRQGTAAFPVSSVLVIGVIVVAMVFAVLSCEMGADEPPDEMSVPQRPPVQAAAGPVAEPQRRERKGCC